MRGRMMCNALAALALGSGCVDRHPFTPQPPIESRAALITAIRYPASVNVNDDVTVRFTVVINPCEDFYFAQDRPDGDAMRFSAWSVAAPCVSATPTMYEVEFFLQRPQRLPRALIFDEPDDVDSVRVLSAKIGS